MFFGSADPYYEKAKEYLAKAPRGRIELYIAQGQPHGFFNDRGDGEWHPSTTYLADAFLAGKGFLTGKPTIAMPQGSKAAMFPVEMMQPSPPGKQTHIPDGITTYQNIEYKPGLLLDVFVPQGPPRPLIVWIHGGAWQNGNKENAPSMRMIAEGFATASIRYCLAQQAPMPAQIDDCLDAIRFLRANTAKYGYDASKIGVWGSSAGGHLAALVGTKGDGDSKVQAVVDWYGPTDHRRMSMWPSTMDHDSPASPESRLLGGPLQQNAELADNANAITFVSTDDPPFLTQHGDADPLVPMEQSELLAETLQKSGVPVELNILHTAALHSTRQRR